MRALALFTLFLLPECFPKNKSRYLNANYHRVSHRLGGEYGNFAGNGFELSLGKRWKALAMEGFLGRNDGNETKTFSNVDYDINVEETYYGAGLRIFFLKYLNIFWGFANHNRVITVPPGCPFQDNYVLDKSCFGPMLSGGLVFPVKKKIDLLGSYTLSRSCSVKHTIEAGIRYYF